MGTVYATYVRLSCEVDDPEAAFSVRWRKDKVPVDFSNAR